MRHSAWARGKRIGLLVVAAALSGLAAAQERPSAAPPAPDRLAWWREAKFGMFVHWGPYSLASVEASWPIMTPGEAGVGEISEADYRALPQRFNPTRFDPREWVQLARAAGQRYIVFTSKHHDGFCMFDSLYTPYKITRSPYGKDILAELAAACREQEMPLGFYYSPPDMNHPGFRDTSFPARANWRGQPERPEWVTYLGYMELQITELLTRYGKVAILWFDGLEDQQIYNGRRFHRLVHDLQPQTLINNRIGLPGDYDTPEQFIPEHIPTVTRDAKSTSTDPPEKVSGTASLPKPEDFRPWETCMTMNETWAYNRHDRKFKSATQLIRTLVDVTSKGGNLLLNVGPGPDGTIQPEFRERLLAIGDWLNVNGDAIYGTTYGPWQNLPFGRTTAKGKNIYLHVFEWPRGNLEFDAPQVQVERVVLLATKQEVAFTQRGGRLRIVLPPQAPDPQVSVLVLSTP
jgi:alpha-L-fucosidase